MAKKKTQDIGNDYSKLTLEDAIAALNEKDSLIADLSKEVENLSKVKDVKQVIVEHKKKKYLVTAPKFNHKGELFTAADLLEKEELVAELVEGGYGVLQEITE